jgi:hypothetical protein
MNHIYSMSSYISKKPRGSSGHGRRWVSAPVHPVSSLTPCIANAFSGVVSSVVFAGMCDPFGRYCDFAGEVFDETPRKRSKLETDVVVRRGRASRRTSWSSFLASSRASQTARAWAPCATTGAPSGAPTSCSACTHRCRCWCFPGSGSGACALGCR